MWKKIWVVVMLTSVCLLISACGHQHQWADATCTDPKTCLECGATEGEALGHKWVDATCVEAKKCSVCGETSGNPLGHKVADQNCTEEAVCERCGDTVPAPGHTWIEATCTEPKKCEVCGITEGEPLGHDLVDGICSRCGIEIYDTVFGTGDDVKSNISTGDGIYRIRFTNDGGSNFIVWVTDQYKDKELLVNTIGAYDGYHFLEGAPPYTFEISSSGNWSYTIERIVDTTETSFSGYGCYVTDKFSASSGTWHITHDGSRNFIVKLLTTNGIELLVNEIGPYDGRKLLDIPIDSDAILIIEADGSWSAFPD